MPKKSNSEQNTQSFIQAARRQIIHSAIFAVAALGVIVFACYAWFASNHSVSGTIGSIQMLGSLYELASEGSSPNKYTLASYNPPEGDTPLSNRPTLKATGTNQSIRWQLSDTSHVQNITGNTRLQPDTSGTLQFYVLPYVSGTLSLNFQLELIPLDDSGNAITGRPAELLKGHLLFYLENNKKEKIWTSWDSDNFKLQFEAANEAAIEQPQKVTLHWMWASDLSGLRDLDSEIPRNGQLLFYSEDQSRIPSETEIKKRLDANDLADLNKLYNLADRYIGANLSWLEVKLTAQPAS
jgi:hypothetical protein